MDLENSVMFTSKFYVKFLSSACYTSIIRSMPKGYIVFVHSVSPFVCLFVRPSHSITKFYFEVFLLLITLQPLIKNFPYLVWGYLGGFSSILHLWTPGSCPRAGLEVKI